MVGEGEAVAVGVLEGVGVSLGLASAVKSMTSCANRVAASSGPFVLVGRSVAVVVGSYVSTMFATAALVGVWLAVPLKTPLRAKMAATMLSAATPMTGKSQAGRFLGSAA